MKIINENCSNNSDYFDSIVDVSMGILCQSVIFSKFQVIFSEFILLYNLLPLNKYG